MTALLMAAARGAGECVALLAAAGADAGHLLGGVGTALHVCADLGLADAVAALVDEEKSPVNANVDEEK